MIIIKSRPDFLINVRVLRRNLGVVLAVVLALVVLLTALPGCESDSGLNAEPEPVGGPPVMRRLTESQYRHTIADVFAPDIQISARFEPPLRSEGLIAIGTGEAGISPFSVEQYDAAARSVATAVVSPERRDVFLACTAAQGNAFDEPCARRFVQEYGPLLLRRPLNDSEVEGFVEVAREGAARLGDFYDGMKYAIAGLMVQPEFLLRVERTQPDPDRPDLLQLDAYAKAARLSFFLTDSSPDRELLRAAGAGELDTAAGLEKQVDRLIASARFVDAVRAFFSDMLEFEMFDDLAKDPLIYPAFNSDVVADAQEQMMRTITDLMIDQDGDYRDLFTTRETYLTRALGVVYKMPVPTRNGWEKQEFPADSGRFGLQSNIGFLAMHSHPGRSSPTLRGMAVREAFLCQEVPDPPANVNFSIEDDPANPTVRTSRELLELHSTEPSCAGCHLIMDPPGLALENFDGVGAYRHTENGEVIDASGSLDGTEYEDLEGFAEALRDHPQTPRCLVEKMYRFAAGRDIVWYERAYMDYLTQHFSNSGYRVPELMRTIALSENFFVIAPAGEAEGGQDHASSGDAEDFSGDRI